MPGSLANNGSLAKKDEKRSNSPLHQRQTIRGMNLLPQLFCWQCFVGFVSRYTASRVWRIVDSSKHKPNRQFRPVVRRPLCPLNFGIAQGGCLSVSWPTREIMAGGTPYSVEGCDKNTWLANLF